jgi:hypothetical protein
MRCSSTCDTDYLGTLAASDSTPRFYAGTVGTDTCDMSIKLTSHRFDHTLPGYVVFISSSLPIFGCSVLMIFKPMF